MDLAVDIINNSFFQALASETRLKIVGILKSEEKNIKELATILKLSTTIIARHINQLEEVGLITTVNLSGKRGLQRVCRLNKESILLVFDEDIEEYRNVLKFSIPIGQYTDFQITPTCGLAGLESLIGVHDDPRFFSHPDHSKAGLIWFTHGWVEYRIPSYMIDTKKIKKISFSMELCSEYPVYKEYYKSDIYFSLNDKRIAKWTASGNPGNRRGKYNPPWWTMGSEYGEKEKIEIDQKGTYINNDIVSNYTISDLNIVWGEDMKLKITSPEITDNPGGVTLFGKGFGDYDQDIDVKIEYE